MTALNKLGKLALTALWAAVAATFGRIMEPFLKWLLFLSMRGLVWLLPPGKAENAIIELYKEFKKSYGDKYDLDGYMANYPKAPLSRGFGRRGFAWGNRRTARQDQGPKKGQQDSGPGVRHQGTGSEPGDSQERPGSLGEDQESPGKSVDTDAGEAGGNNQEGGSGQ